MEKRISVLLIEDDPDYTLLMNLYINEACGEALTHEVDNAVSLSQGLDLLARKATRSDEVLELSVREFELLEFFMRAPGRVFSRVQIYEQVWGYGADIESNLVEVYVQRLRAKIDKDREPKLLRTVRGAGYALGE